MSSRPRRTPSACPVCGDALATTRLSCQGCGTELSGDFPSCRYCGLSPDDQALLEVFLRARGNLKEVERHLGVSYPTARARVDGLLGRLDLGPPQGAPGAPGGDDVGDDLAVLRAVARGEVDVDEASRRLR